MYMYRSTRYVMYMYRRVPLPHSMVVLIIIFLYFDTVVSVSNGVCIILCMPVITQYGVSTLMLAAGLGKTEVVVELVKAGVNVDMQNEVRSYVNTFV